MSRLLWPNILVELTNRGGAGSLARKAGPELELEPVADEVVGWQEDQKKGPG